MIETSCQDRRLRTVLSRGTPSPFVWFETLIGWESSLFPISGTVISLFPRSNSGILTCHILPGVQVTLTGSVDILQPPLVLASPREKTPEIPTVPSMQQTCAQANILCTTAIVVSPINTPTTPAQKRNGGQTGGAGLE